MKVYKKYENCIWALAFVVANIIVMSVCFDFYYDLNDDTMMRDIMSGVYSGTPDGHNMQTLYILGAFISLCYRLCGGIPWYGLFLCMCQFACFYLTGARIAGFFEKKRGKFASLAACSLFLWGVCLSHLVNIQYTVTCAILSATAIFLFVTTPEGLSAKRFVMQNVPSMILVVLAYQLRTEMLLLTMPFIGLAGLYRLAKEKKVWEKENLAKYGTVLGVMLAGMLLSRGIDFIAYGSDEWKDFLDFFEARTTVYDFYPEVVTQDNYGDDLERLGVTKVQQRLLRNYNFGLDEEIDAGMLIEVAEYAEDAVGAARDWTGIFKEKLGVYRYRLFHSGDAPYNIVALWAYAAVAVAGVYRVVLGRKQDGGVLQGEEYGEHGIGGKGKWAFLWQLALLFLVRTALWMFIMVRGREPERITHSLYLVEFALLAALFLRDRRTVSGLGMQEARRTETGNAGWVSLLRGFALYGLPILFALITVISVFPAVSGQFLDKQRREAVNENRYAIAEYCKAHGENFYFEDVYSTVGFSQKILEESTTRPANYDIMGGWICKSPLYHEKLAHYKIEGASEGLADMENVYFIMSDTEMQEQGFDWMIEYYVSVGRQVDVIQTDRIDEEYGVYKIIE